MTMAHAPDVIERFWRKVKVGGADECWLWIASKDGHGYGQFAIRHGVIRRAHRISFEILNGQIPDGVSVLHRCDTPLCVNPKHLFLGTQRDNMQDKCNKGRHPRGEQSARAKISNSDVLEIKKRVAAGEKKYLVASSFGLSASMVTMIVKGKRWARADVQIVRSV